MGRNPRTSLPASHRRKSRALLAALAIALALPPAASAATIAVTTAIDEDNTQNGNCTLREAITAAQSNAAVDLCPAGSESATDLVLLLAGDQAWNAGVAAISGGGPLVVRGPGPVASAARVLIGPTTSRFLRLLEGADVTVENLEIREGDASEDQSAPLGGAILAWALSDVKLTVRNVVFEGNRARYGGGALYFETSAPCLDCRLAIEGSSFLANIAENDDSAAAVRGGAMHLQLQGATEATIVDSTFGWNEARSAFVGGGPSSGALYAALSDTATLTIRRTAINSNSAIAGAGASARVGGASIWPYGESRLTMEDVDLQNNQVVGPAPGTYPATALDIHTGFSGTAVLDRLFLFYNDSGEQAVDLRIEHGSPVAASARNILVGDGAYRGAEVRTTGAGPIELSHWTVALHAEQGLKLARGSGAGEIALHNSIVWSNATDLALEGLPVVDPATNLVGVDPLFVGHGVGNFELTALSPAIDLGGSESSGTSLDLRHAPRAAGDAPDAGAYERDGLFADGFESGDRGAWD